MKLWKARASAIDHEISALLVAENEEQANDRWNRMIEDEIGYYFAETVHEVTEIDGYKVVFRKGKKISLEKSHEIKKLPPIKAREY